MEKISQQKKQEMLLLKQKQIENGTYNPSEHEQDQDPNNTNNNNNASETEKPVK